MTELLDRKGRPCGSGTAEVALQPALMFLPPQLGNIDIGSVDVVCISNAHTILNLPAITEDPRFRGRILATEPTIQFGRMLLTSTITAALRANIAAPHSPAAASRCFDKIESVAFDQVLPLNLSYLFFRLFI